MSEVCKGCHRYKVFGKKCWYFWEGKKQCSQFHEEPDQEPHYKEV